MCSARARAGSTAAQHDEVFEPIESVADLGEVREVIDVAEPVDGDQSTRAADWRRMNSTSRRP